MAELILLGLASLTLRSFAVAALAFICTLRMRDAAMRHAVWATVLGILIVMPLADAVLPAVLVPNPVPRMVSPISVTYVTPLAVPATAAPVALESVSSQSNPPDWPRLILGLYVLGMAILSLRLAIAYARVCALRRRSVYVSLESPDESGPLPTALESKAVRVPMTVGFFKPAIILPADWRDWDDWKLRAVLLHELAHVRRFDWIIALFAAAYKCAFWFNPLAWRLQQQLSKLSEDASDDAALTRIGDAACYAEVLLQFAARHTGRRLLMGGVAMAHKKMTNRIERVLTLRKIGTGLLSKKVWATVIALCLPVLYAAAGVRVAPEKVPPNPIALVERIESSSAPANVTSQTSVMPASNQQPPTVRKIEPLPVVPPGREVQNVQEPQDSPVNTPDGSTLFQGVLDFRKLVEQQRTLRNPSTEPFSFAMIGVNDGKVRFTGGQGTQFLAVGSDCGTADCSFLVLQSGLMAAGAAYTYPGMTGVIFKLSQDGKEISATCHAQECTLTRLFVQTSSAESRRVLSADQTATVSTADPISFSVKP